MSVLAPPLFSRLTRTQALAAFGADARSQTFCDGQFVKLDGAVLVFATVDNETGTRLIYADFVDWRGRDLPVAVRDAFDSDQNRAFHHLMLIRGCRDCDIWLYCGRAHLGSWRVRGDSLIEASFSLEEGRLSPEDWLALGGRERWEIHLKGDARELALDDVAGFAAWLGEVADTPLIDIFMTVPSGATFVVFVNASRAAVFFMAGMAEPFSLSLRDSNEISDAEEIFFESFGPAEFTHERFRTLPRAAGLAAAVAAFRGELAPRLGVEVDLNGFRARWSEW